MIQNGTIERIAFSMLKSINRANAGQILERVGSVSRFFDLDSGSLAAEIGSMRDFCSKDTRQKLLERAAHENVFVYKNKVRPLFFMDDAYPKRLQLCDDAPAMLYALGDCELNVSHVVSIVGTRSATPYGIEFTSKLVADLARQLDDVMVVSGLAYGIDVSAHRAALAAGIPTVGVVAHGLDTLYPAEHRNVAAKMVASGGAIVTEYPSGSQIHRGNFLARNRIVAGLSDVLVVVESDTKGGALATARMASDYGREVCAVPGRSIDRYSRGCNSLIVSHMASMIRDADDLIDLMQWNRRPQAGEQNSFDFSEHIEISDPLQRRIVEHLRNHPSDTVNDMVNSLSVPFPILSSTLMEMEMDDLISALPGGSFTLKI